MMNSFCFPFPACSPGRLMGVLSRLLAGVTGKYQFNRQLDLPGNRLGDGSRDSNVAVPDDHTDTGITDATLAGDCPLADVSGHQLGFDFIWFHKCSLKGVAGVYFVCLNFR